MESASGEREPSPEQAESKEVRMLRALREEEEPPQVPDEQLRSNDQLQQDEMLTLAAIYVDNIGIFGEKDALRSFQIHVHPDGISVSAELLQGVDDDTDSRFFHTFSIRHLAPISLTCLMPLS